MTNHPSMSDQDLACEREAMVCVRKARELLRRAGPLTSIYSDEIERAVEMLPSESQWNDEIEAERRGR